MNIIVAVFIKIIILINKKKHYNLLEEYSVSERRQNDRMADEPSTALYEP